MEEYSRHGLGEATMNLHQSKKYQSLGRRRSTSATGHKKVLASFWPVVFISTVLSCPSLPGTIAAAMAMGQQFQTVSLPLKRTKYPTGRFLHGTVHLCLLCKVAKYSWLQRVQNWFAKTFTCLNCFRVQVFIREVPRSGRDFYIFMWGALLAKECCCGSIDTGVSRCALTIVTSTISVESISWVRRLFCCRSRESKILLATPIAWCSKMCWKWTVVSYISCLLLCHCASTAQCEFH